MQALKLQKKYPDMDIMSLQDQFRRLDVEDKGTQLGAKILHQPLRAEHRPASLAAVLSR